ncbi:MAG: hypothetical protein O9324_26610 [Microcystis sp. LE19-84.1B]|uniref:hypothetical protein n=1 Tax=Microcystis sp. LE19-84.1B TaxID=3016438 RepID=UPI0012BA7B47|nr:hypothetical protein [Microcystis sp. LE19-84.1B]MCZ8227407.1 hypothetical protein [Microcystis sp. LE19-84.1B]
MTTYLYSTRQHPQGCFSNFSGKGFDLEYLCQSGNGKKLMADSPAKNLVGTHLIPTSIGATLPKILSN